MLRAIHNFALKLKGAGPDAIGFRCYSRLGIASAGEDYLRPIDLGMHTSRCAALDA